MILQKRSFKWRGKQKNELRMKSGSVIIIIHYPISPRSSLFILPHLFLQFGKRSSFSNGQLIWKVAKSEYPNINTPHSLGKIIGMNSSVWYGFCLYNFKEQRILGEQFYYIRCVARKARSRNDICDIRTVWNSFYFI